MTKILFSSLMSNIQEVLDVGQKKEVDTWEKGDNSFSDHLFDSPKDMNKVLPLHHPEQEGHKDEIHSHLEPHGYQIKDYKSGIATDKHGRETRIGKALNATKAPEDLKNKFQNDPSRSHKETGSDDLRVTITRHPHHVAGMTSGGHCWEHESCMNFESGSNREFLKQDLKHGTHVAYLHHKDDHELNHPLARIALKKFTDEQTGHSILRPEHKTYGPASDAFTHTVHKFIDHHMPAHEDGHYKKNKDVYSDSSVHHIMGSKKIDSVLEDKTDPLSHDFELSHNIYHSNLHPDQIEKAVNKGHLGFRAHPNATKKQVDKYVNDAAESGDIRGMKNSHNLTSGHIHKLLDSENVSLHDKSGLISENPKVKSEHVMKHIDQHGDLSDASTFLSHKSLSGEHIHKLIDRAHKEHEGNNDIINSIAFNRNLNPGHVDKILSKKPNEHVHRAVLRHKLEPHQVDKIRSSLGKDKFREVAESGMIHRDNLQDNHIHSLIKHYAKDPKANEEKVGDLIYGHSNFNKSHAEALEKHQFSKPVVDYAHQQVALRNKNN